MRGLAQRVVLVTGSTGLLGGAITQRFASENAVVVMASRSLEKAKELADSYATQYPEARLVPVQFDLADEHSICSALDWIASNVGVPTVFVANASCRDVLGKPFTQLTGADFGRLIEVDVAGHFLCAKYLVTQHLQAVPASMVFLSSVYAAVGVDLSIYPPGMRPTPIHYTVAKAGLLGMTRYLAGQWGQNKIRVNAIIAGGVRSASRQSEDFVRNYARKTMLGRLADPEEIANTVAFLASDEASYITGECLVVDGGFSAW